jgi:tape measure domain-containing protein
MADTTSDEYYQISKAADLALSKVSIFQKTVMLNNKTLGSSLSELREHITQIDITSAKASSGTSAAISKKAKEAAPEKKKADVDKGETYSVDGIIKGGTAMLKMAMDLQQTQVAFQQFTGSATTAKALVSSLQEMGATTPFNSSDLMKNAESLLASGTAAANIVPTLSLLGDASMGNKEHLDEMTKAFTQVQTDGKLTTSTLSELVSAGFNPLEEMSRTSGISVSKLQADMNAGKISADQLTNSLVSATGPGGQFFGAMQAQSETASGRWQEFNDRLEMAGTSIGTALLPIATDFINNALIPMAAMLETVATWLSQHSTLVEFLAVTIGGAILGYKLWAMAQGAVNLVMSLNPIGLVVAGIVALIAGVVYAWNTFSGFRGAVVGVWEWLKAFGSLIKDFVIDRIKGMISGIAGLGQAIMYMFQGEWSKAWETGKNAVKDLVGVDAIKHAADNAGKLGGAFSKGFDDGVKMKPISLKSLMPAKTPATRMVPGGDFTNAGRATEQTAGLGGNAKDKVEGITGGGGRNIIINLQKLFDNINITSTTVQEGVTDMEQIVTEALLRVLNSANAIAI